MANSASSCPSDLADVVIIGAGFSGTIAAIVLARSGYSVSLIDRHKVYPPDFRAEHLDEVQSEGLSRLGLLDGMMAGVPCVDHVACARYGRFLEIKRTRNYGITYASMVNAARRLLPATVNNITGRVVDISTGPEEQRVLLADGRSIHGRLLVLASGLGYALCRRAGIERRILREAHSLTFGFDMMPPEGREFPYPFYVYLGERPQDRIDYLAAFYIGDTMRANLFTYRDYREPWTRQMLDQPAEALLRLLPGLGRTLGPFRVPGAVQVRAMDLYVSEQYRRPGVVLIGDAFQTSCPAAGLGVTRLLTDVERLCTVHVPRWMATPGMGVEKIAAFYDDRVKQESDRHARHTAEYRRAVTTEISLGWNLHRQRVALQRRARLTAARMSGGMQDAMARLVHRPASGQPGAA